MHRTAIAFEGAAGVYDTARPSYPADAVQFLVDTLGLGAGRRVLDLAAGTGKLTRALVPSGAAVMAAEPVSAMRRALADSLGGARDRTASVVAAVAQALPVGDGALDAITVGQAFHWFAGDEVLAEMQRAIRPGGGLGLIWNWRDQSDPLQAALTAVMEPLRGDAPSYESGEWRRVLEASERFEAVGEAHVPWRQPVDIEGVADRVASVSFIAALASEDRARLLDRVRAVASEVTGPLALVYVADVFCFTRVG